MVSALSVLYSIIIVIIIIILNKPFMYLTMVSITCTANWPPMANLLG